MNKKHSRLTRSWDKEDLENFLSSDSHSPFVRKYIIKIVQDMYNEYDKRVSLDDPNWTLKRSYRDGYTSALEEILNIFGEEDTNE